MIPPCIASTLAPPVSDVVLRWCSQVADEVHAVTTMATSQWQSDTEVNHCASCEKGFSLMVRRYGNFDIVLDHCSPLGTMPSRLRCVWCTC